MSARSSAHDASHWQRRWHPWSPPAVAVERGPRTSAPEQALAGFLRKHGATREQLRQEADYWVLEKTAAAVPAAALIAEAVPPLLRRFPWPKSMRWGGSSDFTWVRPLRRIVCLLDGAVVPFDLRDGEDDGHGLASANLTEGHRFLAPGAFAVTSCADWADSLRERRVLVDAAERKRVIAEGVAALTNEAQVVDDPGLLDEVTGLVEWPVPLLGRIDRCLHGPAARSPAGLDAGEPALLRLPQPRRLGRAVFRLRRQYRTRGRRRDLDRRQRARAARPFRRCTPLLGPRPQGAAGNRACRCSTTSPSTPNSAPRASGCAGWNAWRRRSPRWSAPARHWHATPLGLPRRTWSPAWSASSPNCKA